MATRKTVKKAAETTTQTQEVKTAEKAAAEAVKAEKAAAKETAMGKGGAPQGASGIYENKRNQAAEYGLPKWHHTGSHDRLDL